MSNKAPAATKKSPRWQLKLTGFGLTWLVTAVVFFVLAANYSNNLLLFIALILIATFINAPWLSWLNIRKLSIHTINAAPVYADQQGNIKVSIHNTLAKLTPGITINILSDAINRQPSASLPLSKNEFIKVNIATNSLVRGRFHLANIQLNCSYPLGLWRWQKSSHSEAHLWVYPAPKGKLALPKPKAKQGTYLKREQGDFSHVRTYQRGDSLNHIAWKQMARTGEVMTKEFEGGEGLKQTVLNYKDLKHGTLETKLCQLCRWIVDCHQKQLKYGLVLPNQTIAAAQGEGHKALCLQALAEFGLDKQDENPLNNSNVTAETRASNA